MRANCPISDVVECSGEKMLWVGAKLQIVVLLLLQELEQCFESFKFIDTKKYKN